MTSSPVRSAAAHPASVRPVHRLSLLTAFLTGGFGVLSGFAIFFLLLEKADKPWMFLAVLAIASVLSALFEWLREQIEHRSGKAHEPWSPARFFVFLIIIAFAEFHVMSWETFTQITASHEFSTVIFSVLGSSLTSSTLVFFDLAVLFGFWVLAGAVLALALLAQLNPTRGGLRERLLRGGWIGLRTGALVAPLCLLVYVFGVWLLRGLHLLIWHQQTWIGNVESLRAMASGGHSWPYLAVNFVFSGLLKGVALFGHHPAGPVVVVIVAIVAVIVLAKNEVWIPAWIVGIGTAFTVMAPLLLNLDAVFQLMLRAAIVWCVPGLVLGAMSPLLRVASEEEKPKAWALIAFASATVLFVVTLLRFKNSWWLLAPTALFVAVGLALRKASRADDYWLPMAAAVAVLVGGLMLGVQNIASFAGVYDSMHRITSLPSELPRNNSPKAAGPLSPGRLLDLSSLFSSVLPGGYLGSTLPERVKSAHQSAAALEGLQRDVDRTESAVREFKTEIACLQETQHAPDPHTKWFERMTHTIETHRELSALIRSVDDNAIAPLEKLRASIATVQAPTLALTEFGVRPGANDPADLVELRRLRLEVDRTRNALIARIDPQLAAIRAARARLVSIKAPIEETERTMRDTVVRWLELTLAASLGYWTAISLLVGWSLQRQAEKPAHAVT
ncbi:MAG TPA: hypothetical protein VHO24_07455 [Opitutaceae bacterium]|nr:hypothetical protein [Opitutaceae bacterium]